MASQRARVRGTVAGGDEKENPIVSETKTSHRSRVLRFTVTSALVIAPLAGCGGKDYAPNPGPVETYAPNPGPQDLPPAVPQPQGPQLPADDEVDGGIDAGSGGARTVDDLLEQPTS